MRIREVKKEIYVEAFVESETCPGLFYRVELDGDYNCTCPDYQQRSKNCKHIKALHNSLANQHTI